MNTATLVDRPIAGAHGAPAVLAPCTKAGPLLARLGALEARLATTPAEREAAFALRYAVFVAEGGARPAGADHAARREHDALDDRADHILVWDTEASGAGPALVGAYRARTSGYRRGGTAALFALSDFFAAHRDRRLCEVGRSCVARHARHHHVLDALWCGLWAYARDREIDVLFGAASLLGADPARHAPVLAALARAPRGPAIVRPHAHCAARLPEPADRGQAAPAAARTLPPLLRGYLALGGTLGAGAACDPVFDTTDLFVSVRICDIPARFRARFARASGRAC